MIKEKLTKWLASVGESERAILEKMSAEQVQDAFYKDLEFGTAGLRGLMGLGSNRVNLYTVIKVSQGIASYLNGKKRICISYDNRNNSKDYAYAAARVFALNGIEAIISKALAPTPYLSFVTRKFKADAGVMITASHNSKEYNGYKVYGPNGCQLTDAQSEQLKQHIDKADPFALNLPPLKHKKIKVKSKKAAYLKQIKRFLSKIPRANTNLKATYTPLNGTGAKYVPDLLKSIGVNVNLVGEQMAADGDFKTCPNPNPESDLAFSLALSYAKNNDSDIVLATDPDADRVGIAVKHGNGYTRLTGNEAGALLADFMLKKTKKANPVIVKTVVTTSLIDKIAKKHGARVQKVLTGFKYIGEAVCAMDNADDFLLGLEDSAGYLAGNYARDKDGVLACALMCLMAADYKLKGKTLIDGLNDLHAEFGVHVNKTLSYKFEGSSGADKICKLMNTLRHGQSVFPSINDVYDFASPMNPITANNNLPLTNMLALVGPNYTLYVRPSGTEPLIKVYIMTQSENAPLNEILHASKSFFA